MIDMIEKPYALLILVFFEWNCITIGYFKYAVVTIFSHEGTDNSLLGVFGKSDVVVHNTKQDCGMHNYNLAWCSVNL